MSRLRISIVTPSMNQAAFLPRAIESVLSQQGDFDLEYLVLDGGSTDGSAEILGRYAGRLRCRIGPDGGQASAVNEGLRLATGDVVGWLNSDDLLRPGALAAVAQAFTERPETLWVHGRCDIVDEADRPMRRWVSAYKDLRCRRYARRRLLLENFVSQMTVFWRRAAHQRVGYLDETLHYALDYDLWLRLSALADPVYLPRTLAAFRWYRTSKSGGSFERQFEEDFRVFRRHAPDEPLLRWRKRLRTAQILLAYRTLRLLGSRPRGAAVGAPPGGAG